MNIVYGGAFNPPSKAHLEIIKKLKKAFRPEHLILLPVNSNYKFKTDLVSNEHRIKMLDIMTKDLDVIISDLECETSDFEGTYHTLKKLGEQYDNIYFVMGADNLLKMNTWIKAELLVSEFHFIVLERDYVDLDLEIQRLFPKYYNNFVIVPYQSSISSSQIRNNLEINKDFLEEEIYEYIIKNNLYK